MFHILCSKLLRHYFYSLVNIAVLYWLEMQKNVYIHDLDNMPS